MLATLVFWVSAALVFYVYLGYPVVVVLLGLLLRRPVRKQPIEPTVSLLVAAYNEAAVIEAKIRNALALDYPLDLLEIVIASDGSTDGTDEIVTGLADGERVRLLSYRMNRGKLAVLNDAVPELRGEIVVFSDASSSLAPDALRQLVASFADPSVGAVCGTYRPVGTHQARLGGPEAFYWRYETFLKEQESRVGSTLGAHGQLYAVRRTLYPFPGPTIVMDDFAIPFRILQQGYRVVYEPAAVVHEEARHMEGFGRRVRIMAGNFGQLREIGRLLRPFKPLALFLFLSHRVGRLMVPVGMLGLALSNVWLLKRAVYRWTLCSQLAFYGLVAAGGLRPLKPRILRLPYYFCMINAAVFPGAYYALRRGRGLSWK